MFPKQKLLILLLLTGIFTFIIYKNSMGHVQLQQLKEQVQPLLAAVIRNIDDEKAVVVPPSSSNIKKVFIDKDGNEVPVFDDDTLFPKPGGGYCDMTPIKDKVEYYMALENPTAQCKELAPFTHYKVCMDGFKNKDNCVVLSFGIDYEFGFEDMLIDGLGCQAYSFDPTMDIGDHERKNGKDKFFKLGLSSFKGVKTISYQERTNLSCAVDRYVNIINMLGLADKEIDFLKIDIEGAELDFFLDTASNHPEMLKNVGQMHLELHNMENRSHSHSGNRIDTNQLDMMKIVDILHCHGFELAYTALKKKPEGHFLNFNGKERKVSGHLTWIRT